MPSKIPKPMVDAGLRWALKPSSMVRELFGVEPDPWQEHVLDEFPRTQRIALLASKGVGKTCVLAWLIWNFMLTREHPKIACISIDSQNLADNLWSELAYWQAKCPLLQQAFVWTKTRIEARGELSRTHWCSARSWAKAASREQQANSLAGLHAGNIMFVLDESGAMPEALLANAENALSTATDGHIVQAGNPTHLDGPLYKAHKDRIEDGGSWLVIPINGDPDSPMRSTRVNIEWARKQIKDYGRENVWVKVNVLGQFPTSSINSLIDIETVEAAMRRHYRESDLRGSVKIISIDVARQGDDSSVIARRQGLQMFPMHRFRNLTGIEGASVTNRFCNEFDPDGILIDATGGFGFTWIDQLSILGRTAIPVGFAEKAHESERFYNRRAEMAWRLCDWIRQGGALPPEGTEGADRLRDALIHTTYSFKGDRIILEDKDMVKAKLTYSPDEMDAAMIGHAETIAARQRDRRPNYNASSDWNPFRNSGGSDGGRSNAYASSDWKPW